MSETLIKVSEFKDFIAAGFKAAYDAGRELQDKGLPMYALDEFTISGVLVADDGVNAYDLLTINENSGEQRTETVLPEVVQSTVRRSAEDSVSTAKGEDKQVQDRQGKQTSASSDNTVDTGTETTQQSATQQTAATNTQNTQQLTTTESDT